MTTTMTSFNVSTNSYVRVSAIACCFSPVLLAREELAAQFERLQEEVHVEAVDVARDTGHEPHLWRRHLRWHERQRERKCC